MLAKIDKLAPYAALALLGYLTYTTLETPLPRTAQGRDSAPTINKKLLNPEPVAGADRASPVGRDPFEVSWASYLKHPRPEPASRPAPASRPVLPLPPASQPGQKPPPPLPGSLVGVFVSDGLTLAVIGDQILKAGAVTGNGDPETNWLVEDVASDSVRLRFGSHSVTLQMRSGDPAAPKAPRGGTR